MKLETIPVILGALICLLGIAICYVAFQPEAWRTGRERRRRVRAEPHQLGQLLLGLGTICMGAALMGRDTWKYSNIVVFAGTGLMITGGIMNRGFLKELLLFRGAARRGHGTDEDEHDRK